MNMEGVEGDQRKKRVVPCAHRHDATFYLLKRMGGTITSCTSRDRGTKRKGEKAFSLDADESVLFGDSEPVMRKPARGDCLLYSLGKTVRCWKRA